MALEALKNIFSGGRREKKAQPLDANLKTLVMGKQNLMERIRHLESEMGYKDKAALQDGELLNSLIAQNKQLAKDIYELCLAGGEDCKRFLSKEEIREIVSESS